MKSWNFLFRTLAELLVVCAWAVPVMLIFDLQITFYKLFLTSLAYFGFCIQAGFLWPRIKDSLLCDVNLEIEIKHNHSQSIEPANDTKWC